MSGEGKDYGSMSLHDLFRGEAESQAQLLTDGLLALEHAPGDLAAIEPLMRAAHSLKGAARIVNLEPVERLAHVMEDCFVAAQKGRLMLTRPRIDRILAAVDMIVHVAQVEEAQAPAWMESRSLELSRLLTALYEAADPQALLENPAAPTPPAPTAVPAPAAPVFHPETVLPPATEEPIPAADPVLKVSSRSFDRLLSLASESRIGAHAWQPFAQALQRHKQRQSEMFKAFDQLRQALLDSAPDERLRERLSLMQQRIAPLREDLAARIAECETLERRQLSVSQLMLDEVVALRMRPFRDGVRALPRMVRDLAHSLDKQARLEITGEDTLVDRDVLARMESPLTQMLRNALDHGIETPAQRSVAGKPEQATIRLDARHNGGMLLIRLSDDGAGVDLDKVRERVIARGMASAAMAAAMSPAELLDFLLLPAFSLRDSASTMSGRGVGLDLVHAEVRALNGSVQLLNDPGRGFAVQLTLPLSQSIVRALVGVIGGEAYALPINRIQRVLRLPLSAVRAIEDRQFFTLDEGDGGDTHVSLIPAAPLLGLGDMRTDDDELRVVVIGNGQRRHGLVVDAILGESSLAVQRIDQIFGKLRDVAAAALLEDGSPVLILDVPDLLVSIEKMAGEGALRGVRAQAAPGAGRRKRVLVVDDSVTVREMERKLLQARGYEVDTAVDGMDGWNAVRAGSYDLVITDVDMPRMDGIELTRQVKADARLQELPVMIVSYKDRPEDRERGIDAGADYYLAKGSFHDETLLEAVFDLIGDSAQ